MKHARYILIAILAVSFGAAALPNEIKKTTKWEKAKQSYIELLNDKNPGVKASAANLIRKYNISEATEALGEVLKCDNCETVKIAAALALIRVAGNDGLRIIKEASKDEENEMVSAFYQSVLQPATENSGSPISER